MTVDRLASLVGAFYLALVKATELVPGYWRSLLMQTSRSSSGDTAGPILPDRAGLYSSNVSSQEPYPHGKTSRSSILRILARPLTGFAKAFDFNRYDLVFLIACLPLFVLMLRLANSTPGPITIDVGNYLLTMRQVFGDDPTGIGLQRPPFVAIPLKIATTFFTAVTATKIVAIVSWIFCGFTGYRLIRKVVGNSFNGNVIAIIAGLGYLLTPRPASWVIWAFITVLGIAFTHIILILVIRGSRNPGRKNAYLLAFGILLLAATHQVSIFIALWSILGYVVILAALRKWETFKFMVRSLVISALLSIWLIPLYWSIISNTAGESDSATFGFLSPDRVISSIVPFYLSWPDIRFWGALFVLALLGIFILLKDPNRRNEGLVIGSFLVMIGLLALGPGIWGLRSPFFLYLPIWLLASVSFVEISNLLSNVCNRLAQMFVRGSKTVLPGRIVLAVMIISFVGSVIFEYTDFDRAAEAGVKYWSLIDSDQMKATNFIGDTVPRHSSAIVSPKEFGWWVEGAGGINALEIQRSVSSIQNEQARVGEYILAGNHVITSGLFVAGYSLPYGSSGTPEIWMSAGAPEKIRELQSSFDNKSTFLNFNSGESVSLADLNQDFKVVQTNIAFAASSISMVNTFEDDSNKISIVQSTTLNREARSIRVDFNISDDERIIHSINIPVQFFNISQLRMIADSPNIRIVQNLAGVSMGSEVQVPSYGASLAIGVLGPDGRVVLGTQYSPSNPGEIRTLVLELTPESSSFGFSLKIVSDLGTFAEREDNGSRTQSNDLQYYQSKSLLENNGIGYIALSKVPNSVIDRLNRLDEYEMVFKKGDTFVYKVISENTYSETTYVASTEGANLAVGDGLKAEIMNDLQYWNSLSFNALSKKVSSSSDEVSEIIVGDVSMEPGRWSGIQFVPPDYMDWSDVEEITLYIRWGTLDNFNPSVAIADELDNRWTWGRFPNRVVEKTDDDWDIWHLRKDNAQRKDPNFQWDRIQRILVSGLAKPEAKKFKTFVEIKALKETDVTIIDAFAGTSN